MEEDTNFFPAPEFGADTVIESDQLLIREADLSDLEDRMAEIEHRATYYGEFVMSKLDFLDMVQDLKHRIAAIRRAK